MISFLRQPYPFNSTLPYKLKIIIAVSLFVLVFHALFQPFQLSKYPVDLTPLVIAAYVSICIVVLSFNLFLIPGIIPELFKEERWNAQSEILWIIWNLGSVGLSIFSFKILYGFYAPNFSNFLNGFLALLAVGAIPVGAYVMINQMVLLKRNLRWADEMNRKISGHLSEKTENEVPVTLNSERGEGRIEFRIKELLFIASISNYAEIYLRKDDAFSKSVLRSTLSKIESSLNDHPEVIRCHRAFLVNTKNIQSVKGNSQSCRLAFENLEEEVPVSRKYVKKLNLRLSGS